MPYKEFYLSMTVPEDTVLWRYINIEKFESLLRDNALFFCRLDKFSDKFEGSVPLREVEHRIVDNRYRSQLFNKPFDEQRAKKQSLETGEYHKLLKKKIIVNCWHINNNENDSMWNLYLGELKGVAITTTLKKLLDSLNDYPEIVYCSKIRYIDYKNGNWYHPDEFPHKGYNLLTPVIHKRIEFKQEAELRLINEIDCNDFHIDEYWESQPYHEGNLIKTDINVLIDKVFTNDYEEVEHLFAKYGVSFPLFESSLLSEPYY